MNTATLMQTDIDLPWVDNRDDRNFRRMLAIAVVLFLAAGVVLNTLPRPPVEKKQLVDVAPRLAQLILEKKKQPPPPPPPKPEPKPEEKPKPKEAEPKPEIKEKPKPAPKPLDDKRQAVREKVLKTGLLSEIDELADLRESFDLSDITTLPQRKIDNAQPKQLSAAEVLTARATQGSGGIKTDTLTRSISSSELAQRKSAQVESAIVTQEKLAKLESKSKPRAQSRRSQEEIELVFQQNKGAIYNIYHRALRQDPAIQGKAVFELTIAPDGQVTQCVIVSSELGNERLERALIARIKKFQFSARSVPEITVSYPIDFLPS